MWWNLAGIFSGGMLGLFLLGILSRRARSQQAVTGMVVGLAVIIWATFSPGWGLSYGNNMHKFMTAVIGTLAIFLVGLMLSVRQTSLPSSSPPNTVHDLRK